MCQRVVITGGSGFIGTNLVEHYGRAGWAVLNVDRQSPRNREHGAYWRATDLLDAADLRDAFKEFRPSLVLHMGARTDLAGKTLHDYAANIAGVQNVIDAVHAVGTVRRAVYASTRFVFDHGVVPRHDYDYSPHTVYGESKVKTEEVVRAQPGGCVPWVIIRPTSIWGPWFDVPYKDFFLAVAGNRYLHPGNLGLPKTYGYVGNVVHEIARFAEEACSEAVGRPLFVSDYRPLDVLEWAELIRREVGSRPIRSVPYGLLKLIALAGDAAKALGMSQPPLTSFRLRNLITPLVYDMSAVERIVGALPYTLEQGVKETVQWLKGNRILSDQ
jgi:nucleoside-diphosphate-sugar epimerase